MLILSRRVGESVVIGEGISVTVLRVKGDQVRLGIDAPKSIVVRREGISIRSKPDVVAPTDESCGEVAALDAQLSPPDG